jgi:type II secretory pathway component GspD/PulD (secretin)
VNAPRGAEQPASPHNDRPAAATAAAGRSAFVATPAANRPAIRPPAPNATGLACRSSAGGRARLIENTVWRGFEPPILVLGPMKKRWHALRTLATLPLPPDGFGPALVVRSVDVDKSLSIGRWRHRPLASDGADRAATFPRSLVRVCQHGGAALAAPVGLACFQREPMALENSRLIAASLTAAVLGAACSTSSSSSTDAPPAKPTTPAGAAATGDTQSPQGPAGDSLQAQRRAELIGSYLRNAQDLRNNGDLGAAKMVLLKAKDLAPINKDVLTLLASVQAELGEPVGRINDFADEAVRLRAIGEERARASVQAQLRKAEDLSGEKDFAGAIEELRLAALTVQVKSDMDWRGLGQEVDAAKAKAEAAYDEQQRQSQAEVNARLAEELRRRYAEEEARKRASVDALILQSQLAFESRQFQRSQDLAQRALELEPNNAIAYEMQNAAVKAGRDSSNEDYWRNRTSAIRKMMEADEDLKIPQTAILRMDPETWEKASGRSKTASKVATMDPQDAAVMEQVRTTQVGRLSYTEETGDYNEVVKNLNLLTGVQIITTPEAREIIGSENLKLQIELVASMTLQNFLNHMVGKSANLAWTVKNGVVVIGNKSQAAGTIVTKVIPVKDLVFKQTQFRAPVLRDIPGEAQSETPRSGGEGEDPVAGIELADLVTALKDASDPKYWETEGVGIQPEDTGILSVKASPEMIARIESLLTDMRRNQTPIVTVDSKFLTISRNFLQEIGIDFRGLGGSGNKGSVVSLDDVTNGLVNNSSRGLDNGGTGDPAANPLAGYYYNDGRDGDVRARTENYFASDLGRVLTPSGGLTAGWTLLDDSQLNLILRAVEKRQDGEVVYSQILSIVNRGRGHVAVTNQTTYVRDFDVEVAQAAFIADPKIDVVQDGLVLDVQPTILNDRKYIILNLTPTVAELERPIRTFTTSLAGSTLPVTLQLPNLTVTNFATTVTVPDGGTVLMGGLRQVLNKERRAGIPLLERLPLIGLLFKQEGTADESRSLMVMVRAQITDIVQDSPAGAMR